MPRLTSTGASLVILVMAGPPTAACGADSVVVVDNRNEVRDFLVSRRARITPERAGLPAYGGNRRVPGLRREEVAMLAGVSIDYYTRLERGNLNGVSQSVLEALGSTPRCTVTQHGRSTLGAVLHAPRDVRCEQRPDPVIIEPTDAIVRAAATCVYGSDLWPYRGIDQVTRARAIGHEFCGIGGLLRPETSV
jgi:hypothetical protein